MPEHSRIILIQERIVYERVYGFNAFEARRQDAEALVQKKRNGAVAFQLVVVPVTDDDVGLDGQAEIDLVGSDKFSDVRQVGRLQGIQKDQEGEDLVVSGLFFVVQISIILGSNSTTFSKY